MKSIYIIAGVVIAIYLLSMTMSSCGSSGCGSGGCQRKPNATKKVTLYHSTQCGHCKTLMPVWLDAKRKAIDNNADVKLDEVEASAGIIPADIQGFPTCEYNGKYYVGGTEIKKLLAELVGEPQSLSVSGDQKDRSNAMYTMYYADWCGYSRKILPIWEAATKGKTNFTKVEEQQIPPQILKEIEGFPVMYVNGGQQKVVGYDNIKAFLEKM